MKKSLAPHQLCILRTHVMLGSSALAHLNLVSESVLKNLPSSFRVSPEPRYDLHDTASIARVTGTIYTQCSIM